MRDKLVRKVILLNYLKLRYEYVKENKTIHVLCQTKDDLEKLKPYLTNDLIFVGEQYIKDDTFYEKNKKFLFEDLFITDCRSFFTPTNDLNISFDVLDDKGRIDTQEMIVDADIEVNILPSLDFQVKRNLNLVGLKNSLLKSKPLSSYAKETTVLVVSNDRYINAKDYDLYLTIDTVQYDKKVFYVYENLPELL